MILTSLLTLVRIVSATRAAIRALPDEGLRVQWGGLLIVYPAEVTAEVPAPSADPPPAPLPIPVPRRELPAVAGGHVAGGDCPCGGLTIPVEHDDGSITFVEACAIDPHADPATQAARAVAIFEGVEQERREGPP